MSDENKHNDLDQFFKSRLVDSSGDANWNNPSDAVFEDAMAVLDGERRKRRGLLLLFVALVIGLMLGYFLWSQVQINRLSSQVEQLSEALKQERQVVAKSAQPVLSKADTQSLEVSQELTQDAEIQEDIALRVEESKSPVMSRLMVAQAGTTSAKVDQGTAQVDQTAGSIGSMGVPFTAQVDVRAVEGPIDFGAFRPMALGPAERVEIASPSKQDTAQPDPSTTAWGVFGGVNWTSLSMTAAMPLPDNLTQYDNWYMGYQYGLTYTKTLQNSGFRLFGRASYTLSRNQSVFEDDLQYNEAMEVDVAGRLRYQAQYNVESPIGGYTEQVDFDVDGSVPDAAPMRSQVQLQNDFKIWSLRTGASYAVTKSSPWNIRISSGLGLHYISEMSHDFQFKLEHESKVLSQFGGQVADLAGLNQVYPSVHTGLEVNRAFGQWLIGLNTSFERSLASIRKVDPSTQVKTHMSTLGASAVVRYQF